MKVVTLEEGTLGHEAKNRLNQMLLCDCRVSHFWLERGEKRTLNLIRHCPRVLKRE